MGLEQAEDRAARPKLNRRQGLERSGSTGGAAIMSTTMREDTSTTSHFPAPAWATSSDEDGDDIITWSREVEFAAIEVDGWAGLTVGAQVLDTIVVNDVVDAVIDRGTPEIEITRDRPDGEADGLEVSLRFEAAGAGQVATALLELCDAAEHAKATL
jgi:hypothetical protein